MKELNMYCYEEGENICFHMDVEQRIINATEEDNELMEGEELFEYEW